MTNYLNDDLAAGEVRATDVIDTETGQWVITRVLHPDHDDDLYRAYPTGRYSDDTGMICTSAGTKMAVIRAARDSR